MKDVRWLLAVVSVAIFAAIVSCSPDDLLAPRKSVIQPMCQYGYCQPDPDPNPDSIGVWASSYATDEICADTYNYVDYDEDGMSDDCEYRLANAFAPTLYHDAYDSVTGEPAYAVRPSGTHNGHYTAMIIYLLSEYIDLGTTDCGNFPSWTCGHYGDGESVVMRIRYESDIQHWVLDAAFLSMHNEYGVYCRDSAADAISKSYVFAHYDEMCANGSGHDVPEDISYTGNSGGAPYIYASMKKHANYGTEARCDVGSPWGIWPFTYWHDQCTPAYTHTIDVIGPSPTLGLAQTMIRF